MGLVGPDDTGGGRGGEDPPLAHQHPGHPVGGRHPEDGFQGAAIMVATIAPHHQSLALQTGLGVEHRLDEVFQIVGLLEDLYLLAQPRGAGFLTLEGCCLDGCHADSLY